VVIGISLILVRWGHRSARGVVAAVLLPLTLLAAACGPATSPEGDGRLSVVAGAYPLAEVVERVGGDLIALENLTPPGVEPHDLELAPDELERVLTADLVVLVGAGFQPAVEEAAAQAEGSVVDVLEGLDTLAVSDDEGVLDPHVWLDPRRLAAITSRVAEALAELDPANAGVFRAGASAFIDELKAIDEAFRVGLETCASRTIVVNHAAFTYLADAYRLVQVPISGASPESEPDPARLADLRALVEREGIGTIFTEELASPDVAETLAAEAGVATAMLDPIEGLTEAELQAGADYGSVMLRNLETLRGGLGCR
jgi:zinc transport system substrate-binding protein